MTLSDWKTVVLTALVSFLVVIALGGLYVWAVGL